MVKMMLTMMMDDDDDNMDIFQSLFLNKHFFVDL